MDAYPSQIRHHDYQPKILRLNRYRSPGAGTEVRSMEAIRLLA